MKYTQNMKLSHNHWLQPLQEKATQNPIDFAEFMATALYHPTHGYYTNSCEKIGRDFTTAPMLSELFGQTLAHAFSPYVSKDLAHLEYLNDSNNYYILEIGAGNGDLATQILSELINIANTEQDIKLESKLEYHILEISPTLQKIQHQKLSDWALENADILKAKNIQFSFKIYQNIDDMNNMNNIDKSSFKISTLVANEWLDANPVNLWRFDVSQKIWQARKVGFSDNQGWHWCDQNIRKINDLPLEIQKIDIQKLAAELLEIGHTEYITESHESSASMLAELLEQVQPQQILLIDYGHLSEQYYHAQRNMGTLLCYFQQQVHAAVFENIGKQDITAHVNFSQIIDLLTEKGWQIDSFSGQARFLLNCGILDRLLTLQKKIQNLNHEIQLAKLNQGVLTLLSEAEMGEGVKVLEMSLKL